MEQDELIIWVYLWVCDEMARFRERLEQQGLKIRRGGFAPQLSDEEALCIELCGEMLRLHTDKGIVAHFQQHYPGWFPHIKERTAFVRQVANLWRIKAHLLECLSQQHHLHEQLVQPVDTLPLPVCAKVRARRAWGFADADQARKSFCAAKDVFYFGFKLGLRVTEGGFISHYALLQANTHDCRHLPSLVEGHEGYVPVDKGFFDPTGWRLVAQQGAHVVGRGPKRVDKHRPQELKLDEFAERACARIRKVVEVVASLLCGRFGVDRIRVHDQWHFDHRLLRKILAFNLLLARNLELGRPLLDLDGLVGD